MGDTQFLSGTVVAKREEDGRYLVDLELHMINQRDTETAYGSATVALPSRAAGLPIVPARARRPRSGRRPRCSPATTSWPRSASAEPATP